VDYGSVDMDIAAEANRSTFKRWVGPAGCGWSQGVYSTSFWDGSEP